MEPFSLPLAVLNIKFTSYRDEIGFRSVFRFLRRKAVSNLHNIIKHHAKCYRKLEMTGFFCYFKYLLFTGEMISKTV